MLSSFNDLLVVLIFGALVMLAFLLIANPLKVNKAANLYFGSFLALWATFWLEEVLVMTGMPLPNDGFWIFLKEIQFFTPILFFISIRFFANPNFKYTSKDSRYLWIPIVYLLVLLWQQKSDHPSWLSFLLIALITGQAIYYTIISFLEIRKHSKRIEWFRSNKEEVDLRWIQQIIIALFSLSLFITLYNVIFLGSELNLIANGFMLLIILYVAFFALKQKEIFLVDQKEVGRILKEETPLEEAPESLEAEWTPRKLKLQRIMEQDRPYLRQELSLSDLAQMMELSPHDLSYLLNNGFGQNFYFFINQYRVEAAKTMLSDPAYDHLNILGIAFEAGFNSKTTFNTVFKKLTGDTPTAFKKKRSAR